MENVITVNDDIRSAHHQELVRTANSFCKAFGVAIRAGFDVAGLSPALMKAMDDIIEKVEGQTHAVKPIEFTSIRELSEQLNIPSQS